MFGHDDNQGGQQPAGQTDGQNQFQDTQLQVPAMGGDDSSPAPSFGDNAMSNAPAQTDEPSFSTGDQSDSTPPNFTSDDAVPPSAPMPDETASTLSNPSDNSDAADTPVADEGLLSLKQQALQQLTPLVNHLEQTPEEEFRTTMMMIQASDNKDLVQKAFDAAQKITDEKAKAQALLDVINEINYFTQQQK